MNPNEFHQMYKYLVHPSREKVVAAAKKELGIPQEAKINNGTEILDWINYNQKAYGDNTQPMTPEERKTGESIEKSIADAGITTNTPPKNKKEPTKNYIKHKKTLSTSPKSTNYSSYKNTYQ